MKTVAINGTYCRVADPEWADPLDLSYAAAQGQRNGPARLPTTRRHCRSASSPARPLGFSKLRATDTNDGGDTFHEQFATVHINRFFFPMGLKVECGSARFGHSQTDR